MGELHLDIIVDRLKREFNVDCKVGAPQVRFPGFTRLTGVNLPRGPGCWR